MVVRRWSAAEPDSHGGVAVFGAGGRYPGCLIPRFDGAILSLAWKGAVFATGIGASDAVVLHVGQLAFDGIRVPDAHFVEQGRRHHPEAVGRHFLLGIAHPAQRDRDRVFGHGPLPCVEGRKDIGGMAGQGMHFLQYGENLTGQRHLVRPAHLHLLGRDRPDGAVEIELAPLRPA